MSSEMQQNILDLGDSIIRNRPVVEARLRRSGTKAPEALVLLMAKYWDALERLAAE